MKNIVLIGMPSSGKTTIGQLLSGALGMEFTDTDALIQAKANKPLRDIVNEDGLDRFLEIQQNTILDIQFEGRIIATGGSVIYGDASMKHLKQNGIVIFLKLEYEEIQQRITSGRRFARNTGQGFYDMFVERMPLYEKYADRTIDCSGKQPEEIVDEIKKLVSF